MQGKVGNAKHDHRGREREAERAKPTIATKSACGAKRVVNEVMLNRIYSNYCASLSLNTLSNI